MLQSRRGFLIGAGGFLTAGFVDKAHAFVSKTGLPLLIPPPEPKYWLFWMNGAFALGPTFGYWPQPQVSWRIFLTSLSILDTPAEFEYLMARYRVTLTRLDEPVDNWEDLNWDIFSGNWTGAYRVLRRLDLGPSLNAGHEGPCLEFHNDGYADSVPICSVTASHPVALSLLQARLIELKLPICVRLSAHAPTTADYQRQVDEFVRASVDVESTFFRERLSRPRGICGFVPRTPPSVATSQASARPAPYLKA